MTDYLLRPLLDATIKIGMNQNLEIHKKWVHVQHRFSEVSGRASLTTFPPNTRLDLVLRQLEAETLETINDPSGDGAAESEFVTDFAVSLAEMWLMRSYELVRAAKCFCQKNHIDFPPRLSAVLHDLALVRMPIDKGEIEGAIKKANKPQLDALELILEGSDHEIKYAAGNYIPKKEICAQTGAIIWYPVNLETGDMVGICRRDLSDALLSAFD
jgi:hypothetical protein